MSVTSAVHTSPSSTLIVDLQTTSVGRYGSIFSLPSPVLDTRRASSRCIWDTMNCGTCFRSSARSAKSAGKQVAPLPMAKHLRLATDQRGMTIVTETATVDTKGKRDSSTCCPVSQQIRLLIITFHAVRRGGAHGHHREGDTSFVTKSTFCICFCYCGHYLCTLCELSSRPFA